MSKHPKVSVIVPIYNTETYMEECLSSILNQTLQDIEIICIDDGSKDNSVSIVKKYMDEDKRFSLIYGKHCGAGNARNLGLKQARGDYLYFLDSDDFIAPNCIESLYLKATETNADVVICASQSLHVQSKQVSTLFYALKSDLLPARQKYFNCQDIKEHAFQFFNGWPWDKLYKHKFITQNKLKYQNTRSSNDLLFVNSAVILANRISIIPEVLVTHRIGDKNSLENTRYKDPFCFLNAMEAFVKFMKKKNLYERYEQSLKNYLVEFSLWHIDSIKDKNQQKILKSKVKQFFSKKNFMESRSDFYNPNVEIRYKQLMTNKIKTKIFNIYQTTTHKIVTFGNIKIKWRK